MMTFILVVTLAGTPPFPDATAIEFDTAKDCGTAATLVVGLGHAPIEATCYESVDGKTLGKQVSGTSRK